MNNLALDAILMQAQALVSQIQVTIAAGRPAAPPPDPGHFCPNCKGTKIRMIEHGPDEHWRIRCHSCGQVSVDKIEPIEEAQ